MNLYKWIIFSLFFAIIIIPVTQAANFERPQPGFYRMQKFGELRCGYSDHPPYIYADHITGEVKGPLADFAHNMVGFLKVNVKWIKEENMENVLGSLNSNKYEVYCGFLPFGEELKDYVLTTETILDLPYYLYVRADDEKFTEAEDALNYKDVSIFVQQGSLAHFVANEKFSKTQIRALDFKTVSDMVAEFVKSDADILLADPAAIAEFMRENTTDIKIFDADPLTIQPIIYAIGTHNEALLSLINNAINGVHLSGKANAIFLNYDMTDTVILRAEYEAYKEISQGSEDLPPCATHTSSAAPKDESVQQMLGVDGDGKSEPDSCFGQP